AAWRSGQHMVDVWYSSEEDASAHQAAMECVPDGKFEALALSPLASGRLDPPDIALFYATPGAMIYFINGLQWAGYKRFDWSVVGESACADSWGRALKTRQPSLSIPCFAERRYGGVLDDEMLMALPPDDIPKAIAGEAADPPTPHLFRHFLDALALETIQHIGGHGLAYGGLSRV